MNWHNEAVWWIERWIGKAGPETVRDGVIYINGRGVDIRLNERHVSGPSVLGCNEVFSWEQLRNCMIDSMEHRLESMAQLIDKGWSNYTYVPPVKRGG